MGACEWVHADGCMQMGVCGWVHADGCVCVCVCVCVCNFRRWYLYRK